LLRRTISAKRREKATQARFNTESTEEEHREHREKKANLTRRHRERREEKSKTADWLTIDGVLAGE
jgi:hypothetical protein